MASAGIFDWPSTASAGRPACVWPSGGRQISSLREPAWTAGEKQPRAAARRRALGIGTTGPVDVAATLSRDFSHRPPDAPGKSDGRASGRRPRPCLGVPAAGARGPTAVTARRRNRDSYGARGGRGESLPWRGRTLRDAQDDFPLARFLLGLLWPPAGLVSWASL